MRTFIISFVALLFLPSAILAQNDPGGAEIIVTAQRSSGDGYDSRRPQIGLRRLADFAVQEITITDDTRDEAKRHDEMYAMVKGAIELATKRGGIELATGSLIVEPLTLGNYRHLGLEKGRQPDSNKVSFLIKTKLASGVDAKAAIDRVDAFIKAMPTVGRAEVTDRDDLTLSVVSPDQYRPQIIDLVAADAHSVAAKMGSDYAVEIKGLDRPVEWGRANLTDIFLFVPYTYNIVPKAR